MADSNIRPSLSLWQTHYLPVAVLLSLAVHIAVLAVHLAPEPPAPAPVAPTLEIALVNLRTDLAPVKPDVMAQQTLHGGGEDSQGIASSQVPVANPASPNELVLEALRKRQAELEQQQYTLLAQLTAATDSVPSPQQPSEATASVNNGGEDDIDQEAAVLSARIAILRDRVQTYSKQPRLEFTGPSAIRSSQAAYLEAWRQKVEAVGTTHYPAQARGRIYGSLQATVFIRADGTVDHIEIDRPSEHALLNQAARRILQLAAPFPPFPADLAHETDVLAITRTWHFVSDHLETRIP